MSIAILPTSTAPAMDAAQATSTPGNQSAPAPANPFAALLNALPVSSDLDGEGVSAEDSLLPAPEAESETATDSDDSRDDSPWPPEGLASLWLPVTPEPAPEPTPVSGDAFTAAHAPAPESAVIIDAAAPAPSAADTTATHVLEPQDQVPANIPHAAADNTASLPEPAPHLADSESLSAPNSKPLSHTWERGWGEGVSAADPVPANTPQPSAPISNIQPSIPAQPSAAPPAPTAPYPAPNLHADNFPDTLSTHIHWLAEHKIGHAQLHLHPQDMGPLEVRLKLDGDQLQADFMSTQPEVRHTLEQGLPRLRELLGEHGLNLAQADIGQQPSQRHSAPIAQADDTLPADSEHADHALSPSAPVSMPHSSHLVDAYA